MQDPISIWVDGESGPRRQLRPLLVPGATNPQFPMNTVTRFKAGLARLHAVAEKAGRNSKEIAIALRVLTGPKTRPRRSIEGEAEIFTGGDADWVNDIQDLAQPSVSAVDVRLFGYGADQRLDTTVCNMHRFRDGVLAKL